MEEIKNLNGALDKETEEIMKKQVDKAISTPEQMNRVLINLFGEMLEELKKVEHAITNLNSAFILANKDALPSSTKISTLSARTSKIRTA